MNPQLYWVKRKRKKVEEEKPFSESVPKPITLVETSDKGDNRLEEADQPDADQPDADQPDADQPDADADQPDADADADQPEVKGQNSLIGFWLMPESNSYVKLAIFPSYTITIPGILRDRDVEIECRYGSSWIPIWSIVANRDMLASYFPWIARAMDHSDIAALLDPESDKHDESVAAFQETLIGRGWCFWIQEGDTGFWCGSRPLRKENEGASSGMMQMFVRELSGGVVAAPTNVVTEYASVTTVTILNHHGSPISNTPIETFLGNETKQGEAKPKDKRAEFAQGHTNHQLRLARNAASQVKGIEVYGEMVDGATYVDTLITKGLGQVRNGKFYLNSDNKRSLGEYADGPTLEAYALLRASVKSEATFRQLISITRSNGGYVRGGLRLVAGRWVIDPSVAGRYQNARYVIPHIPNWVRGQDGLLTMRFVVRSRVDRSTTGMNQSGFVKLMGNNAWWARWGRKLMGRGQWDIDCHVSCSCPDWKYRFHYVMAQMGAADTPTGIGGEATNEPPTKTNPHMRPSLCKHLVAIGSLLQGTPREFRDEIEKIAVSPIKSRGTKKSPVVEPLKGAILIADEIDDQDTSSDPVIL